MGIVRQHETAAVEAASAGKSSVFQRKLSAVYTPSTLEIGTIEDVGADLGTHGPDDEAADLSSYLMCVWEEAGSPAGVCCRVPNQQVCVVLCRTNRCVLWCTQ